MTNKPLFETDLYLHDPKLIVWSSFGTLDIPI